MNVTNSPNEKFLFLSFATGWSHVYGYNMSCLKNYVMREPLVDSVDKRQIATDHCALKSFDLKTLTIDDIKIDSPFQLRAIRDDYLHAFVTYFVVEFSACPQRTVISTGKSTQDRTNLDQTCCFSSARRRVHALETHRFLFS